MKLHFDEITEPGITLSIDNSSWFPQNEEEYELDLRGSVFVKKPKPDMVMLNGSLIGHRKTNCDRCASQVDQQIKCDFAYRVTTRSESISSGGEYECTEEDIRTLYIQERIVEVDAILREQAYLAIPMQSLCDEDCKGICSGCGVDLNQESCQCQTDSVNSPFAVLKKLGRNQ